MHFGNKMADAEIEELVAVFCGLAPPTRRKTSRTSSDKGQSRVARPPYCGGLLGLPAEILNRILLLVGQQVIQSSH